MFRILNVLLCVILVFMAIRSGSIALSSDSELIVLKEITSILIDFGIAILITFGEIISLLASFFARITITYDPKFDSVADSEGGTKV